MKIIHISDIHYPKTGNKLKTLCSKIIEHYEDEGVKPIIVLTGDILETSTKKRHFAYAATQLHKLKAAGFHMLIIPGNHDIKRDGGFPVISGRKRFNKYFKNLLPDGYNLFGEDDNDFDDFPLVHQFNNFYFIGLDSMEQENGIGATGDLGSDQLNELQEVIDEINEENEAAKITVYLHHNPFKFGYRYPYLKLKDRLELLDIVEGTNVLLFGHFHNNIRYTNKEDKHNIGVIQLSGDCTFSEGVRWHEIDIEAKSSNRIEY